MRKDASINGNVQRIEQLVWMFFLKVYDTAKEDWELENEGFKSIPLLWRNWAPSKDEESKPKSDVLIGQLLLDFIKEKLFRVLKAENSLDGKIKGIQVTKTSSITDSRKPTVESIMEQLSVLQFILRDEL